jgi:murein DD-endopeptidase MepM/ murein hydrolase activator NlpD
VKSVAKLAIILLLSPGLLAAQAQSGQKPSNDQTEKPAYEQPADTNVGDSNVTLTPAPVQDKDKAAASEPSAKAKPKAPAAYPIMSTAAKNRARQLYDYFARGQSAQLYAAFSSGMKKGSTEARLTTVSRQMNTKLGNPGETMGETYMPSLTQPATVYARMTKYSKAKSPIVVVVAVNEQGELDSLQIVPVQDPPADQYADYQDKVKLHLPFDGAWMVAQGGRRVFDNAFASTDDDRYTVGFMFLKDNRPFDGEGKKNEDYFCYGQPVLAPAAGTVVQIVNGVADHQPGKGTDVISHGNYVVISHGNNEYSMLPYLKNGSLKVRNGARVKQGDPVGECGDSGSSYAPHVEYRLQNTRGFPLPVTLPAQFVDYTANGKEVAAGEPVRGQMVSNKPSTPAVETAEKPK